MLASILKTSPNIFQAFELHIRKPSFLVGNKNNYTRNIFKGLGLDVDAFDKIRAQYEPLFNRMNLGAWVGPKEAVSAEPLTGLETTSFSSELQARGQLVSALMQKLTNDFNCSRWGFKILGDVIHIKHYAKTWPNATVIFLIRDPRDHALSIMKLNKGRQDRGQQNFYNSYADVAQGWLEAVTLGLEELKQCGLSYLTMRYEDLVTNTHQEISRLSQYLNIDLSEGISFYNKDFISTHTERFQHLNNLLKPINSSSVGRWRADMSKEDLDVFKQVAKSGMELWGYALN